MPRKKDLHINRDFDNRMINDELEGVSKKVINLAFDKFDKDLESWDCFVQRLENYFDLLCIAENEEKKTQTLIQNMGIQLFQEVCDYVSPVKPRALGYENLVKTVESIVNPRPSRIIEQHNFGMRKQNEGERVRQYITELKKMSKYCGFFVTNVKLRLRNYICDSSLFLV